MNPGRRPPGVLALYGHYPQRLTAGGERRGALRTGPSDVARTCYWLVSPRSARFFSSTLSGGPDEPGGRDLPVVMFSAARDARPVAEARRLGAADRVVKGSAGAADLDGPDRPPPASGRIACGGNSTAATIPWGGTRRRRAAHGVRVPRRDAFAAGRATSRHRVHSASTPWPPRSAAYL